MPRYFIGTCYKIVSFKINIKMPTNVRLLFYYLRFELHTDQAVQMFLSSFINRDTVILFKGEQYPTNAVAIVLSNAT